MSSNLTKSEGRSFCVARMDKKSMEYIRNMCLLLLFTSQFNWAHSVVRMVQSDGEGSGRREQRKLDLEGQTGLQF